MSNTNNIKQVACGIQFSNAFKMLDRWGEIADEILYSDVSQKILGKDYFNNITSENGYQRQIFNSKTQNSFRLTHNNIIFSHNIGKDFITEYDMVKEFVQKYIFPKLIKRNILVVNRIGIVFTNILSDEEMNLFKGKVLSQNIQDVTDFRFAQKSTTIVGITFQDKNDFINRIYSIGGLQGGNKGISYDFQYYFSPPNAQAEKIIENLFKTAFNNFETDVLMSIEGTNGKKENLQ